MGGRNQRKRNRRKAWVRLLGGQGQMWIQDSSRDMTYVRVNRPGPGFDVIMLSRHFLRNLSPSAEERLKSMLKLRSERPVIQAQLPN